MKGKYNGNYTRYSYTRNGIQKQGSLTDKNSSTPSTGTEQQSEKADGKNDSHNHYNTPYSQNSYGSFKNANIQ